MPQPSTLLCAFAGDPQATALVTQASQLTFGELDLQANRLGNALLALGLKPGDLFAFLMPNAPEILLAYIACARTGIVGLPLSQRITAPELLYQLGHAHAKAMWCDASYAHLLPTPQQRSRLPVAHWLGPELLRASASASATPPPSRPDESSPYCVMFTGGTTGTSKAAVLSHRSWRCVFETSIAQWGLTAQDRHLIALPMSHAAWYTAGASLLAGGRVTLVRQWDPRQVLELIEAHRITTLNMIPTMLNDLIHAQRDCRRDVSSVRLLTVAGSVLPVATYQQARDIFGEAIGNVYGLTELAGPVTFLLPEHMRLGKFNSVGKIGAFIEMALLDDDGNPVQGERRGELGLAGPQVTLGYLNAEQETRSAFSGRWFRTGDIAELDDEGFLYIVDRKKDMIKTGGFNVYPSEVEQALYDHAQVLEAAVIGLPDEKWSEAVHAVVVTQLGATVTDADLIAHCRGRMAGYKAPKAVHFMAQLPRTRFGKFDKALLRQRLLGLG